MTADGQENGCNWTREEDEAFENALATYPEDCLDRWDTILADVSGKSLDEIQKHYELLIDDVNRIELGCVPLPTYCSTKRAGNEGTGKKGGNSNGDSSKGAKLDQERRKGVAWTEDEHRLFLLGLEKYGKGDWRSISRNFVVTRTPTQVASHAQKYFIRLNSMNKYRRRSSIHDITNVTDGDTLLPQGPITGSSTAKSAKQNPPSPNSITIYGGTTIGQPVGPLSVGTLLNLPLPAQQYGGPITYQMIPHAPSHR